MQIFVTRPPWLSNLIYSEWISLLQIHCAQFYCHIYNIRFSIFEGQIRNADADNTDRFLSLVSQTLLRVWAKLKEVSLSPSVMSNSSRTASLDDVIKWKYFSRHWPFVRGLHRSPVNSSHKASDAELRCFLWSAPEWMVLGAIAPIMTLL